MSAPINNLQITIHLDGSGVYYDPYEPPMLDAIMACIQSTRKLGYDLRYIERDDEPTDIKIPLWRRDFGKGLWLWHASAFFPESEALETLQYWRKRFRQERIELTSGSPNLQMGIYRDYNHPMPLLATRTLTAYARGNRRHVKETIKNLKWIGKKRAHGRGNVTGYDIDIIEDDYSLTKDGKATRYLPDPNGARMVRLRPPYWNNHDRVQCCEIGSDAAHLAT